MDSERQAGGDFANDCREQVGAACGVTALLSHRADANPSSAHTRF